MEICLLGIEFWKGEWIDMFKWEEIEFKVVKKYL